MSQARNFDPYKALGVSRGTGTEEIKKARDKLMRQNHSDKNKDAIRHKAQVINNAYEVLSDKNKEIFFKNAYSDNSIFWAWSYAEHQDREREFVNKISEKGRREWAAFKSWILETFAAQTAAEYVAAGQHAMDETSFMFETFIRNMNIQLEHEFLQIKETEFQATCGPSFRVPLYLGYDVHLNCMMNMLQYDGPRPEEYVDINRHLLDFTTGKFLIQYIRQVEESLQEHTTEIENLRDQLETLHNTQPESNDTNQICVISSVNSSGDLQVNAPPNNSDLSVQVIRPTCSSLICYWKDGGLLQTRDQINNRNPISGNAREITGLNGASDNSTNHPILSIGFKKVQPAGKSKRIFTCEHCEKTFTTKMAANRHTDSKHAGIRFDCPFCLTSLHRLETLQAHVKRYHSNGRKKAISDSHKKESVRKRNSTTKRRQTQNCQ